MRLSARMIFLVLVFSLSACWGPVRAVKNGGANQDNPELAVLFQDDQQARKNFSSMTKEALKKMAEDDRARRERVLELYQGNVLSTGEDFYRAAMVLQHGENPEDFILAHELSVAAVLLGCKKAAWLAAATEDRFLTNIGRKQRFGTQFNRPNSKWRLKPIQPGVTDQLRRAMGCPSLDEARKQEAWLNENF
jgi:hypothetical protein